mmetsp:Transcript_20624/g.60273  ORF Transcript_20624/g.60273 Transcript_20624/m.60273 type:complete len:202 (-) Transcript_20624:5-610(-)
MGACMVRESVVTREGASIREYRLLVHAHAPARRAILRLFGFRNDVGEEGQRVLVVEPSLQQVLVLELLPLRTLRCCVGVLRKLLKKELRRLGHQQHGLRLDLLHIFLQLHDALHGIAGNGHGVRRVPRGQPGPWPGLWRGNRLLPHGRGGCLLPDQRVLPRHSDHLTPCHVALLHLSRLLAALCARLLRRRLLHGFPPTGC